MESLQLSKPHLIIMVGIPGSGRSFFAEHFAETFKAPIISSDLIRSHLLGTPTYSANEDIIINKTTSYILNEIMKTNRTLIFKGQTGSRSDRAKIAKLCHESGYEPLYVWTQVDDETAKKRYIKKLPISSTLANSRFELEMKRFSSPQASEKPIVISGKHTYNSQLRIVLQHLVDHKKTAETSRVSAGQPDNRRYLIR